MIKFINVTLELIEKTGFIPIKWFSKIVQICEKNPRTSTWIGIAILSLITGSRGLPFLGAIYEAVKGLIKK